MHLSNVGSQADAVLMFEAIKNSIRLLDNFAKRTLYAKLLLLLFCLLVTVLLIQASSFFLVDYIPSSQAAIDKVSVQKVYWHQQLSYIDSIKLAQADKTFKEMQAHFLQLDDPDVQWMMRQSEANVSEAVKKVEQLQQSFTQVAGYNMRLTAQLRFAERISESYDELSEALYRDAEIKRMVIMLLQSVCLVFVISCILVIALSARQLMVDRFDSTHRFIRQKVTYRGSAIDEYALIEQGISEISAQLDSSNAKVSWANQASENVKSLIRSQDFLLTFIESASQDVMSERTLLKMLYSLERTFKFNNAAIVYTDDAIVIANERVIFSHHKPAAMSETQLQEIFANEMLSYTVTGIENQPLSCLAIKFVGASNEVGILLVEMEPDRQLDSSEIKVLEITAHLLEMIAKYQSHDEEGRRLAVLEERSAIARELHDSLAQSLSFMKIQMARLQSKQQDKEKLDSIIQELREGLDNAYRELRELLTTFRVHMDLRGLGYAVQAAIDEFSQRSDIAISLDNRLVNCRLTVNEEFHILHVVREALSNIVRHSGAQHVSILMLKKSTGTIELTIDDDGVGLAPGSSTYDHHGQAIMKERALNLGGKVDVMNRRHGGARVRLVFTPKLAQ